MIREPDGKKRSNAVKDKHFRRLAIIQETMVDRAFLAQRTASSALARIAILRGTNVMAVGIVGAEGRQLIARLESLGNELLQWSGILVTVHVPRHEYRATVLCLDAFCLSDDEAYLGSPGLAAARLRGISLPPKMGGYNGKLLPVNFPLENGGSEGFGPLVAPFFRCIETEIGL
jgi:hypothetical protein